MAFQLSPGINVSEVDLTTYVPSVSTTIGAFVGDFSWGPVNQIVTVDQEATLIDRFGKPTDSNFEYWFSASNFLAYANSLRVVRASATGALNATETGTGVLIENETDYIQNHSDGVDTGGLFAAKYPGTLGNSLSVELVDSNTWSSWAGTYQGFFTDAPSTSDYAAARNLSNDELHVVVIDTLGKISGTANTVLEKFGFLSKASDAKYSDGSTSYYKNVINNRSKYIWWLGHPEQSNTYTVDDVTIVAQGTGYSNGFITITGGISSANIQIGVDTNGNIISASVIAGGEFLSPLASPSINLVPLGGTTGSANLVFADSGDANGATWGTSTDNTTEPYASAAGLVAATLSGGASGSLTNGNLNIGWDQFVNGDNIDVSLLFTGPANTSVSQYAINNIAEVRKDCVVFVSPKRESVIDNYGEETSNVKTDAAAIGSSSYAFMDSGWKYQYDKFNDTYRWIPLNGDIAGLTARSDQLRDPWFSPAGLNRGGVKNVIRLAWNPSKADRDDLYAKGINPVVTFSGEGTILYGDKTLLSRPSAFDRINVRRLFITLQKAISVASRSTLFEFNDQFTRAQFVALVEPYLRDVQGRRGIFDFRVVCDETNNTPEVIDRNEFVGDIYIKPARSINFIQLNFVAVRTGVSFNEIVGKF
jgi:phage tail sheath protein FI